MTRLYKPDYLERAAYKVLAPMLTIPLLHANQQQQELDPPYATLSIDSRSRQGRDTVLSTSEDGVITYYGQRNSTLTLLIVGDECGEIADTLVNNMQQVAASGAYRKHGVVMHSATPINLGVITMDATQQVEQAVAVDVSGRYAVMYTEDVGIIEIVVVKYKTGENDMFAAYLGGRTPQPGDPVVGVDMDPIPPIHVGELVPHPAYATIPDNLSGVATVEWVSSDDSIVTPDTSTPLPLKLRGVAPGTAIITLTMHNSNGTTTSDQLPVTVIA